MASSLPNTTISAVYSFLCIACHVESVLIPAFKATHGLRDDSSPKELTDRRAKTLSSRPANAQTQSPTIAMKKRKTIESRRISDVDDQGKQRHVESHVSLLGSKPAHGPGAVALSSGPIADQSCSLSRTAAGLASRSGRSASARVPRTPIVNSPSVK
jgi:hypothetical protein